MKIFKNINFIKILTICLLLTLFIFISAISYVNAVSNNISNSVFRLHIIANSDSEEDQNLKLKVRDNLLIYMNDLSKNCNSKLDVINIVNSHKNDFQEIAEKTIKENGFNYNVSIQVTNSYFPTKTYGDVSLPVGDYDCLKVNIGNSKGHNWWCVMFPPLCFVDVSSGIVPESSKKQIKSTLNDEEYNLITTTDNSEINFKFKLVELFQNWKLGKID